MRSDRTFRVVALRLACVTLVVALGLAGVVLETGCAHFIVRPTDPTALAGTKVAIRTASAAATLGGTEVYVYRAKAYESGKPADGDHAVRTYWGVLGALLVVASG